jgi:outer membrane receptor protein involved in Fe transport
MFNIKRIKWIGYVLSFMLLLHLNLIAQEKPKNQGVQIIGKIIDISKEAIPFASIALYTLPDSSLFKGTTSDIDGNFELFAKPGNYYLTISFLSFQNNTISVELNPSQGIVDLGKITLKKDAIVIDEVEIIGEKSTMQLSLDKRVYNVGKDISNAGSNASEILDNVPSVNVDSDGNVNLRGSGNVRILIDGKQSGFLRTSDALKQLQGDLIERIEVITNPSARYDAEGEVGIINIVLKKDKREGINGGVSLFTGWPHNHGTSVNINVRRKKMNLFANYGINGRKSPGFGTSYNERIINGEPLIFESDRNHTRGSFSNNIRIGSDFILNKYNTLTVSGFYNFSQGSNDALISYTDLDALGNILQVVDRTDDELESTNNFEGALVYQKLFEQKDRSLNVDFKYNISLDRELSDYEEKNLTYNFDPIIQKSSNTEDETNLIFQTDYIHPLGKDGKVEAGLKSANRTIRNFFSLENFVDDDWVVSPIFDNEMAYTEGIYAAYLMTGNKMNKFSYQLGVRSEYSDIKTDLKKTNEVNHRKYIDFFPSAHFTYELKNQNSIQWSYSRRISRPNFRNLLPFFGFSDSRNFFSGNPNINPEYANSVELSHMKYWEKGSLFSSIYYRYKTDVIQRITIIDSTGLGRTFPVNLGIQHNYGVEFNFSRDITSSWKTNGNFNFFRATTIGSYENVDYNFDNYAWTARFSSKMNIKKMLDYQVSFNYRSPQKTAQGRMLSMYNLDMGLSKDILKDKGTITFNVRDIFNTRKRRYETIGDNFYSVGEFQWMVRQFTFNFTYRINQKKGRGNEKNQRREGAGGSDSMDSDF